MTRTIRQTAFVATLLMLGGVVAASSARAAEMSTDETLKKLHQSNTKEIHMGKMAQEKGQSKEVKAFGKMLVKDHGAADKKVMALAKEEKLELGGEAKMSDDMASMPTGAAFDSKFAQAMVDDHKKDIAEAKQAHDGTSDAKLKKLLEELIPTLEKHQETAQKIVDAHSKSASR
jgi:putative membrane protein